MEFYKMFCVIHRRTDWPRLYEWERRCMMPEWYEERERKARAAMAKLFSLPLALGAAMEGKMEYMNEKSPWS